MRTLPPKTLYCSLKYTTFIQYKNKVKTNIFFEILTLFFQRKKIQNINEIFWSFSTLFYIHTLVYQVAWVQFLEKMLVWCPYDSFNTICKKLWLESQVFFTKIVLGLNIGKYLHLLLLQNIEVWITLQRSKNNKNQTYFLFSLLDTMSVRDYY